MASIWLEAHGKAILVKGDTMQIKDFLKTKGGKWNGGLKSWLFPGSKKDAVMQDLQSCSLVKKVDDRTGSDAPNATSSAKAAPEKAAPEKPEKAAAKRSEPDAEVIELDDNVRITVNAYQGKIGVDVRRFYRDKASGELRPGKGLRMSEPEWEAVCAVTDRIDNMLKEANETSWSVEGDLMVSITGGSVDLRRYYTDKNDGEKKPGKQGTRLSGMLWASLKAEIPQIAKKLSEAGAGGTAKPQKKQKKKADEAPQKATESDEHKKWRLEIKKIVQGKDLEKLSARNVREQLEETLGLQKDGLLARKDEVNAMIKEIVVAAAS